MKKNKVFAFALIAVLTLAFSLISLPVSANYVPGYYPTSFGGGAYKSCATGNCYGNQSGWTSLVPVSNKVVSSPLRYYPNYAYSTPQYVSPSNGFTSAPFYRPAPTGFAPVSTPVYGTKPTLATAPYYANSVPLSFNTAAYRTCKSGLCGLFGGYFGGFTLGSVGGLSLVIPGK